jgi:hypothetical protein
MCSVSVTSLCRLTSQPKKFLSITLWKSLCAFLFTNTLVSYQQTTIPLCLYLVAVLNFMQVLIASLCKSFSRCAMAKWCCLVELREIPLWLTARSSTDKMTTVWGPEISHQFKHTVWYYVIEYRLENQPWKFGNTCISLLKNAVFWNMAPYGSC